MNKLLCIRCEKITVNSIQYPRGELSEELSNRKALLYVINQARYEERTLFLLMAVFGFPENWYMKASYDDYEDENMIPIIDPIDYNNLDEELESNQLLSNIFQWEGIEYEEKLELLEPIRGYISREYGNLGDIYDKDIDVLSRTSYKANSKHFHYKYIICYVKDNIYQGHIYMVGKSEVIGIRTSLRNTILRLLNKKYTQRVSYVLFSGCVRLLPHVSDKDRIIVSNPIGAGRLVAEKFGMDDMDEIHLNKEPKVEVPEYEFYMLWR